MIVFFAENFLYSEPPVNQLEKFAKENSSVEANYYNHNKIQSLNTMRLQKGVTMQTFGRFRVKLSYLAANCC